VEQITPQELKARLDRREAPMLLDVREDWETKLCRLPNAMHIPIEEIEVRIDELDPEEELVVFPRAVLEVEAFVRGRPGVRSECARADDRERRGPALRKVPVDRAHCLRKSAEHAQCHSAHANQHHSRRQCSEDEPFLRAHRYTPNQSVDQWKKKGSIEGFTEVT